MTRCAALLFVTLFAFARVTFAVEDDYSNFASAHGAPDELYEPTPYIIVEQMLDEAHLVPGDVVIDLGCGDGRIPVAAARRGARAIGVDIDPQRILASQQHAAHAHETVEWRTENLFTTDLRGVTVVMLFLSPRVNAALWPRLQREVPHARVVSYAYEGPVPPTRIVPAVWPDPSWGTEPPNRAVVYVWERP